MRWRQNHRHRAINRIDARGEDFNWLCARQVRNGNLYLRALRLPDPVALHQDDAFRPSALKLFQIIQQLIRISRGLQEPLFDLA